MAKRTKNSSTQFARDDHFRAFAKSLEKEIRKYGHDPKSKDQYERQKQQVETLLALEAEFRDTLVVHRWGISVYREFVDMITNKTNNRITARPYFRERGVDYTNYISPALKTGDYKALFRFRINYMFVLWVMGIRDWHKTNLGFKICKLAKQISLLRTEIAEINMPLALNRARIFLSSNKKSTTTYMEFVSVCVEGMLAGIDKYCPPPGGFTRVFRSVLIGRMVGNLIDTNSATLLNFTSDERKVIYRSLKATRRHGIPGDYVKIAREVNSEAGSARERTTPDQVGVLLTALVPVSASSLVSVEDGRTELTVDRFAADESLRPDNMTENSELSSTLRIALKKLPLLQQKLLTLRGLAF